MTLLSWEECFTNALLYKRNLQSLIRDFCLLGIHRLSNFLLFLDIQVSVSSLQLVIQSSFESLLKSLFGHIIISTWLT